MAAPRPPEHRTARLGAALLLSLAATPADAANCEKPQQVAPGVYLIAASSPEATPQNGGRGGNSVLLLGSRGVTVIDPGPSLKAGRALRCSLRRLTARPVVALINSHPHPKQVLANGAFPGVPIYASQEATEAMRERCAPCRERLAKQVGEDQMAGTVPHLPNHPIERPTALRPGGRALLLLPLGHAHSPGDLVVIDRASGTLISGDLGNSATLPVLTDGRLAGWISALRDLLERRDVATVIPGFGPPTPLGALNKPLDYLQRLRQYAEDQVGKGEMQAPNTVPDELRPFGNEAAQLLNLQHAMREAEERWWVRAP